MQAWAKETGQLHKLPYPNKNIQNVDELDPLIIGHAHVVHALGERPGSAIL